MNSISVLMSAGSSQSIFSAMNLIQLMLLFPLLRFYLPELVIEFYKGLEWTMMSFDFISVQNVPYISKIWNYFENKQKDEYLGFVGIEHQSSLLNLFQWILILLIVISLHIFIALIHWEVRQDENPGWISKLVKKFFRMFTFEIYIRTVVEIMMIASISSFSEIYALNSENRMKLVSLIFAFVIVAVLFGIIVFNFIIYWKHRESSKETMTIMFGEYFNGLKINHCAKLYTFFETSRKFALCLLLILLQNYDKFIKLGFLIFIQLQFTLFVIIVKPFNQTRDNIREILNEVMIPSYALIFLHFNTEGAWNDTVSTVKLN